VVPPAWTRERAVAAFAAQRAAAVEALCGAGYSTGEVDTIIAASRDVIGVRARNAYVADKALGATRLAGVPDLPADVAWPTRDGYGFDFVGQLAMADLAALDVHDALPHDGVLSLFTGHDITEESEHQLDHRIALYRAPVWPLEPPDGAAKPCGVDFEPVFTLPPPWSSWDHPLSRTDRYLDVHDSIYHWTADPVYPQSGLLGFDRPHESALAGGELMLVRLDDGEGIPYAFFESCTLCFVIAAPALARWDLAAVRSFEGASV
jgi:hypothetical protein